MRRFWEELIDSWIHLSFSQYFRSDIQQKLMNQLLMDLEFLDLLIMFEISESIEYGCYNFGKLHMIELLVYSVSSFKCLLEAS